MCAINFAEQFLAVILMICLLYEKFAKIAHCFFSIPIKAFVAQLDRVQVSEACGVGSSPAERTKIINFLHNIIIIVSLNELLEYCDWLKFFLFTSL